MLLRVDRAYALHRGRVAQKYETYFEVYQHIFNLISSHLANYSARWGILELGVGTGGALEILSALFPSAHIAGIDSRRTPRNKNNIIHILGRQDSPKSWDLAIDHVHSLFCVIDDASHIPEYTFNSFELSKQYLQNLSGYIIEDLHTHFYGPVLPHTQTLFDSIAELGLTFPESTSVIAKESIIGIFGPIKFGPVSATINNQKLDSSYLKAILKRLFIEKQLSIPLLSLSLEERKPLFLAFIYAVNRAGVYSDLLETIDEELSILLFQLELGLETVELSSGSLALSFNTLRPPLNESFRLYGGRLRKLRFVLRSSIVKRLARLSLVQSYLDSLK